MAVRPFAFGVRMRHGSRTLRVRQSRKDARRYFVEDARSNKETKRRDHASLDEALRDLASTWRKRLH